MKYIFSNGLTLEVRDISEPLYKLELKPEKTPLPIITKEIVSDEEARKIIKGINREWYKRTI